MNSQKVLKISARVPKKSPDRISQGDIFSNIEIIEGLEVKGNKYELIGTIEHLVPSRQSVHFIANCKHFDNNWYIFSDSSIYTTKNNYQKYGIPYLLFYRRED